MQPLKLWELQCPGVGVVTTLSAVMAQGEALKEENSLLGLGDLACSIPQEGGQALKLRSNSTANVA